MWQRFTEASRKAIVRAELEAIQGRSEQVEAQHLLLALLNAPECAGAQILLKMGVTPGKVRTVLALDPQATSFDQKMYSKEIEKLSTEFQVDPELIRRIERQLIAKMKDQFKKPELKLSDRMRRILELSSEEARQTQAIVEHANIIGTTHLLLGLLRDNDNPAASALQKLGLNLDLARLEVIEYLRTKGEE
ncbi:hypothetical protein EON83_15825 [bacterium]|nr:MAG: hypothetical protein EON83_15825 [bacterium]